MSLRATLTRFLRQQLGHKPGQEANPGQMTMFSSRQTRPLTAEDEEVVRSALSPDPEEAIDTLLRNSRPSSRKDDFSCTVNLYDPGDDTDILVSLLAAGASLGMVLVDDKDADLHHVHRDFYRLLGRLRANVDIAGDTSVQLAYREHNDGGISILPLDEGKHLANPRPPGPGQSRTSSTVAR